MAVNREDFQEAIVKIGRVTKVVKGEIGRAHV